MQIVLSRVKQTVLSKSSSYVYILLIKQTILISCLMRSAEFVTFIENREELKLRSFINNNSNIAVST